MDALKSRRAVMLMLALLGLDACVVDVDDGDAEHSIRDEESALTSSQRERINALKLYDLSIRIRTSNVPSAGTDDPTYVSVNGERFYLDLPGNDFERNDNSTYTLPLFGDQPDRAATIGSIPSIVLGKKGSDGLCLGEVEVVANRFLVLARYNFAISSDGFWLDDENGHQRSVHIFRTEPAERLAEAVTLEAAIEVAELIDRGERPYRLSPESIQRYAESWIGHRLYSGYGNGHSYNRWNPNPPRGGAVEYVGATRRDLRYGFWANTNYYFGWGFGWIESRRWQPVYACPGSRGIIPQFVCNEDGPAMARIEADDTLEVWLE